MGIVLSLPLIERSIKVHALINELQKDSEELKELFELERREQRRDE